MIVPPCCCSLFVHTQVDASIRYACSTGASCQAANVNMDRQRLSPAEGASHSHFSVEKPIPATFSDAIDAIGMGRFQNRLLLLCGMVSLCCWLLISRARAASCERSRACMFCSVRPGCVDCVSMLLLYLHPNARCLSDQVYTMLVFMLSMGSSW